MTKSNKCLLVATIATVLSAADTKAMRPQDCVDNGFNESVNFVCATMMLPEMPESREEGARQKLAQELVILSALVHLGRLDKNEAEQISINMGGPYKELETVLEAFSNGELEVELPADQLKTCLQDFSRNS